MGRGNNDHDRLQEVWHAIKDENGLQIQVMEIRKSLLGDPLHPENPGLFADMKAHVLEHGRIEKELAEKVKIETAVLARKTKRDTTIRATVIAGLFSIAGVVVLWCLQNAQLLLHVIGMAR